MLTRACDVACCMARTSSIGPWARFDQSWLFAGCAYAARFLRSGDMVIAVNGQPVKSVAELKKAIAAGVSSLGIGREGMVSTIQFR